MSVQYLFADRLAWCEPSVPPCDNACEESFFATAFCGTLSGHTTSYGLNLWGDFSWWCTTNLLGWHGIEYSLSWVPGRKGQSVVIGNISVLGAWCILKDFAFFLK